MYRRFMHLLLAVGIAIAIVFGFAGVALAAQQTYNGDTLQMIIQDNTRSTINVKSSTGGGYVGQYFNFSSPPEVCWGSVVYLDNAGTWSSYGDGYTHAGLNAVSNTTNAVPGGTEIVTVADLGATGVRMTQTFTHKTGDRFVTKKWVIHNGGATTFAGGRFYHGGDTYFGDSDSARGYYDATKSMVYLRNNDYTNWGIMGFYANPGTPADRYFEGAFSLSQSYQSAMTPLPDTVDANYVDAGYQLEWDRSTLAPGDTWTIEAYEIWTPGGALQMIAPGTQNAVADSSVTLPFTVQNLGGTALDLDLSATSDASWVTSITGGPSLTVPANGSTIVNVQVTVPPGVSGASAVTLAAAGGAVGTAVTTLNIVSLDLSITPSGVDFGTIGSSDSTSQVVTVTNNGAVPVTFGTVTAPAPFAVAADGVSGVTLAAGDKATVRVDFASGTGGAYSGSLRIPTVLPVLVTRTIPLSGTVASNHTVTFLTDGTSGSSLTGSTSQSVADGARATTVTANSPVGYHFVSWTGTGGFVTTTSNPLAVTNVAQNMTLTAHFAVNSYTLVYAAGAHGTISGTATQTVNHFASGTQVTAAPDADYHFVRWSDGVLTASRREIGVTGPVSVTASFAIDSYVLGYAAGAHGTISGVATQTVDRFANGTQVTAVPDVGYHFLRWSDGVTTVSRREIGVRGPVAVTASFEIDVMSLSFAAGTGGTLSGSNPQAIAWSGDSGPVLAVPDAGYHFVNWTGTSGFATTLDNPVRIARVLADMTLTAHFAINRYVLSYAAGAHGTISGAATQTVDHFASGTRVTAVPDAGYHFAGWSDGVTTASRRETGVAGPLSITASFAIDTYTLSYAAAAHGAISGMAAQVVDHSASGSAVTAVPDAGYHFVRWSDGVTTASRREVGVVAPLSVTASFAIDELTLSYSAGAGGTISGADPQTITWYASGGPVTAVPNAGYHFVRWSDGVMSATRIDERVTSSIDVTAYFAVDVYEVDYEAGSDGTIAGAAHQKVSRGGSATPVTAVPNAGYRFVRWSDGVTAATRSDSRVMGSLSLNAAFTLDTFTARYVSGPGGTIDGQSPQTIANGASGSPVRAVPAEGHHFLAWSDGVTTAARTDVVTGDIEVTARFAVDTYAVSYSAGPGGTVSGQRAQTVPYAGAASPVTAVPDPGYVFVRWSDGVGTAARTDAGVTGPLDVTAAFAASGTHIVTHTLTYSAGPGGTISGASPQTVADGENGKQVTAVPDEGYRFVGWSDGVSTGSRIDSDVTADLSATASFEAAYNRFGGPDRYAVSSSVAGALNPEWADVRHVLVVCGSDRAAADPITAGPLAGAYNAPILMVREDRSVLPSDTVAALRSIAAANPGRIDVHLVGGPGSVPDALRAKIVAAMPSAVIDRIGGADRYELAANVATRLKTVLAADARAVGGILFANGQSTAGMCSALALAPIGSHEGMPILLVKASSVPAATTRAVSRLGVATSGRYVAGPVTLVSSGVLRALGVSETGRMARATDPSRSGTAVAIAETALSKGWLSLHTVGLANRLPDAMTGSTLMGRLGGPLLYTEADVLDPTIRAFLAGHRGEAAGMRVFGGTASISDAVVAAAWEELQQE